MTEHLTEDEVIAAVPGLTRTRLVAFIETEVVLPLRRGDGAVAALVFRKIDVARMQVLCNLAEDLELDDAALAVVVALIDKLHATRQDLLVIARAVAAEPPDVRARIGSAVLAPR
jgi:chaperone modulatory protein CbpM